jgi:hypothetical protein
VSVDKDAGKRTPEGGWLAARLREEVAAVKRPGMTSADIAARISEDLRPLFWRQQLDIYFDRELGQ